MILVDEPGWIAWAARAGPPTERSGLGLHVAKDVGLGFSAWAADPGVVRSDAIFGGMYRPDPPAQRLRGVAYTSIHETLEHPAVPCPPPGMRST